MSVLRRVCLSILAVFVALGFLGASLAPRVADVETARHLSAPVLGLALLGVAAGLVVAAPVPGAVLHRTPPRPVIAVAFVPFAAAVPLVAVAGSVPVLFALLFAFSALFAGSLPDHLEPTPSVPRPEEALL